MGVAVKDAVGPGRCLAVVKGQGDGALKKSRIFKRLDGWIEVTFIRKVNAFQYGPLGVEQITLVALAGEAVLGQATVGAGAGPAPAAQVEAQLLAASVAPGARVGSFKNPTHAQLLRPALVALAWVYDKYEKWGGGKDVRGLIQLPFSLPLLKTVTSFKFTPRPLLMVKGSLVSVLKPRRMEPFECALKQQTADLECAFSLHRVFWTPPKQHMDLCCCYLPRAQNKYYGSLNWQFWGQRSRCRHITVATEFTELHSIELKGGGGIWAIRCPYGCPANTGRAVNHNIRTWFHFRLFFKASLVPGFHLLWHCCVIPFTFLVNK